MASSCWSCPASSSARVGCPGEAAAVLSTASKYSSAARWPLRAASARAVEPVLSVAAALAPYASRARTHGTLPTVAARCSGVWVLLSRGSTATRAFSSWRAHRSWPAAGHRWVGTTGGGAGEDMYGLGRVGPALIIWAGQRSARSKCPSEKRSAAPATSPRAPTGGGSVQGRALLRICCRLVHSTAEQHCGRSMGEAHPVRSEKYNAQSNISMQCMSSQYFLEACKPATPHLQHVPLKPANPSGPPSTHSSCPAAAARAMGVRPAPSRRSRSAPDSINTCGTSEGQKSSCVRMYAADMRSTSLAGSKQVESSVKSHC